LRYSVTGKLYLGPRRPRQLTRYFRGKVPESWLVGGSQGILVTAIWHLSLDICHLLICGRRKHSLEAGCQG